jgi:hypothetical protein
MKANAYPLPAELAHRVVVTDTGCWRWTGSVTRDGYGHLRVAGRMRMAHRYAWELLVGPIPPLIELDHTCHVPRLCSGGDTCEHRRCCNPAHLEPVRHRDNVLRSGGPAALAAVTTHCPAGHPYTGRNLVVFADGKRRCRACRLDRDKRWKKEARRRTAT